MDNIQLSRWKESSEIGVEERKFEQALASPYRGKNTHAPFSL